VTRTSAASQSDRALGESLYVDGRLPARDRTIAILRICGLLRCAYEWGGQAAFWGPIAGVSEAECDALAIGTATDNRWSAEETWASRGQLYDVQQRMELMIVVGWYRTICTLCNGMALPVEGWMRPWPSGV
jgi:hypothetical protein